MPRRFADLLARLRSGAQDGDRQRLLAILSLNRELAKAEGRRALLLLLVDEAVRLFGAERGFLITTAGDPNTFTVEVARSLDREAVQHPERKLSSTILNKALGDGDGVYSADAQAGELSASQSIADLKLRSVLCMPIRVGERILGCIYLDHRFQQKAFAESDLPWLQAFADQGAIALHLHDLLAQTKAQEQQLAAQNRVLQQTVASQAAELVDLRPVASRQELRGHFDEIVGDSPLLLRALQLLERTAAVDFPVLITGESGTGKELAAQALHRLSRRAQGPFVAVNVGAIQPSLLESELFGHRKGAFTGADRDRPGLVQQASGGTLFLDEITEMDLELQARLLRFLEERQVRPVGGDTSSAVDLRIVAASNKEPLRAVAEGRLREDLYYRLAVVVVTLPPLRQRLADVPLLVQHFLAEVAAERGGVAPVISPEVMAALRRRSWPGNLRQLRNEVQRLCALAGEGPISVAMLSPEVAASGEAPPAGLDLAALERWAIERALRAAGGNKAQAARLLGIGRRTLYSKLGEVGE